jgi:hypothetical protein
MSNVHNIQDRTNKFQIKVVGEELKEAIVNSGTKIDTKATIEVFAMADIHRVIIPDTMNKLQASYNLLRQFEEEETFRNYNKKYDNFFVNDFMVAIQVLIKKYFGMLHVSKFNTAGAPVEPNYIQIPIGFENGKLKNEKGYLGSIKCPCWEDCIADIGFGTITIKSKLKFEGNVNEFLKEVENYIRDNSVIAGHAVTLSQTKYGLLAQPINPVANPKIVLEEENERIIKNLIIPSLADTAKTSLLFTGDYGTGKTETAIRIGVEAVNKYDRTFFYLKDSQLFLELIPYLKNYQHSLCFVEDIDTAAAGDRTMDMNQLLNTLDGNELKNVDCTFIFTTNNEDTIHPSMRRPGRIDQIAHFCHCTNDMVAEIYRRFAKDAAQQEDIDFDMLATKTPENLQGAIVAEISKRALKYAEKLHDGVISSEVFLDAIASMRQHIEFMRKDQSKDHSIENALGQAFYTAMRKAFPNIDNSDISNFTSSPYQELMNK